MSSALPKYIHPMERGTEELPDAFTFPFRYTPHPLCQRAALIVQDKLQEMGVKEGKMFGVLIAKSREEGDTEELYFLAAYSGQLNGEASPPTPLSRGRGGTLRNFEWFVPPIVDYFNPECYFQKEQREIMDLGRQMDALKNSEEVRTTKVVLELLKREREEAIEKAKRVYAESRNDELRNNQDYIRLRQHQKADIQRAKQIHAGEIAQAEGMLAGYHLRQRQLYEERKRRSEALQQWLFNQFVFLNGRGEQRGLVEIFKDSLIPSGAGECCAPKLLQTAYQLGLEPLAMAEFWWGPSSPTHYRQPGAFFPACRSKCYPILSFMLQGLNIEPDPAEHYELVLGPIGIVWEDEYLAVVNKPNGWCSIPGRSDQANLYDEAHRLWPDIEGSVIVHRLDQDTSGVMVIAKNARVHRALSIQFERREVKKKYVAILEVKNEGVNKEGVKSEGVKSERCLIPSTSGTIQLPIGSDLENMPRRRVDWENGKEAVTVYEVLGEEKMGTRIAFYPQTGRTHQLRIHSASAEGLNAPIVGDRLYGQVADRLLLHAESIDFEHPVTHERMHFEVPCPF